MLDVKRLIGEVAAQNGIRLEPDDPAFALVTLNQLALEETTNRLLEQISATLAQFTESLRKGEHLAGKRLAQEVKAAVLEARKEWAEFRQSQAESAVDGHRSFSGRYLWLAVGALSGMALTAAAGEFYRIIAAGW
jgi:hypothetical protein